MPIPVHCRECNSDFHVKDDLSGKSIRCPLCKHAIISVLSQSDHKNQAASQWQIRGPDGQIYGPVSKIELDKWVAEGRITEQTMIHAPGQNQWLPASVYYPQFSAGSPYHYQSNAASAQLPQDFVSAPKAGGYVMTGPVSHRSKIAAGVLGLLLGPWGIHRFYLGFIGIGILQILVTLVTCGIGGIWGFIEGILYLVGSMDRDVDGRILRD